MSEGLGEFEADFFALESFGGNFAPVGEVARSVVAVVVGTVGDGFHEIRVGFSSTHTRLVDGDLSEPGAEFGFGAKLAEIFEGFEDSFLGDVFGVGFVAEDGEGGGVEAAFVGADEFVEEIVLAGEDAADEGLFVGAGGVGVAGGRD